MYLIEAQYPEWRPDSGETSERKRVLSIEALRTKLGVAAPSEPAARAKAKPEAEVRTPPRIVRRKELIAAC